MAEAEKPLVTLTGITGYICAYSHEKYVFMDVLRIYISMIWVKDWTRTAELAIAGWKWNVDLKEQTISKLLHIVFLSKVSENEDIYISNFKDLDLLVWC